jgi:hypothetical protein
MGVFSAWQPKYATVGIVTFPVNPDTKIPLVTNWHKFGIRASTSVTSRFEGCNGIAFACGARNGITILDIDLPDEALLQKALDRHGDTPLIERTASGKFHAWYKHNGERRSVKKLWGEGFPIDLLGGGQSVAAPSTRADGSSYEFYRGSLADVPNLPVMRGLEDVRKATQPQPPPPLVSTTTFVKEGERNNTLFRLCLRHASKAENVHQLMEHAMSINATFNPPLSDSEAMQCALSAWRYEERGRNFVTHGQSLVLPISAINQIAHGDGGDALVLLTQLERYHWDRDQFVLANKYAETLGWTLPRFRKARDLLVEADLIRQLTKGGRFKGDAPLFAWPTRQKAA